MRNRGICRVYISLHAESPKSLTLKKKKIFSTPQRALSPSPPTFVASQRRPERPEVVPKKGFSLEVLFFEGLKFVEATPPPPKKKACVKSGTSPFSMEQQVLWSYLVLQSFRRFALLKERKLVHSSASRAQGERQ